VRRAGRQRSDALADVDDTRRLSSQAEGQLERARRSLLVRWFLRSRIPRLKERVREARQDCEEAQRRIEAASVDVDFDLEAEDLARFEEVSRAFEALVGAAALWDVTSIAALDQRVTRSAAQSQATRRRVTFAMESPPALRSAFKALRFGNANGADVYLLPALALVGQPANDLAVLDLRELSIGFRQVSCVEEEEVPSDALVLGRTWERVNKDGTPDRRFRDNRQVPTVAADKRHEGGIALGQPCSIVDCPNLSFADPPVLFPFTTTNATALKGSSLRLTNHGEAFDCANFATPHSGGALVVGAAIALPPVGDTADSIRFSE
jgi:hypothetical protein